MDRLFLNIIKNALVEDIGSGDITSNATIHPAIHCKARFKMKESGIIAGLEVSKTAFSLLDDKIKFTNLYNDGDHVQIGSEVAIIEGAVKSILSAERVALNFLQRMSGIATATSMYVEKVKKYKTIILDTRKTVPGIRVFDKWAVRLGGGQNHREGLYDMILIKDNHIIACGSISNAIRLAQKNNENNYSIEVEVKNLNELIESLKFDIQKILLDNMSTDDLNEAVKIVNGKVSLEASGNININNVEEIAATGVDFISIGKLTHSVSALDISLNIEQLI